MNDLKTMLEEALQEENSDAEKYMNMADSAKQEWPGAGYDKILRDIAQEEMVHHKHLQEILTDMHHKEQNDV